MKINALIISIALPFTANALRAQETRSRWHSVQGLVVNEMGRPAAMATVYLKDAGGHRLRMKQTDRSGRFSFGLVNISDNYEIYAEQASFLSQKLVIPTVGSNHNIVLKLVLRNKEPAAARLDPKGSTHDNR
jgi:hypothetical protein